MKTILKFQPFDLRNTVLFSVGFLYPFENLLKIAFHCPDLIRIPQLVIILMLITSIILIKHNINKVNFLNIELQMCMLSYFIWAIITSLLSYYHINENHGFNSLAVGVDSLGIRTWIFVFYKTSIIFIFIYCLYLLIDNLENIKSLFNGFMYSLMLSALYGIYQFIGSFIGLPFIFLDKNEAYEFLGLPRAQGFFIEPGPFGIALTAGITLLFLNIILKKKFFANNRMINLFLIILFFVGIIFSFSTNAYINFFLVLLIILAIYSKLLIKKILSSYKIFIIIIPIIMLLPIILPMMPIEKGYDIIENSITKITKIVLNLNKDKQILLSPDTRASNAYVCSRIASDNLLTGVGCGNIPFHFYEYIPNRKYDLWYLPDCFNFYLKSLSETGLIGLTLLSFMLFFPVYMFFRYFYPNRLSIKAKNKDVSNWVIILFIIYITYSIINTSVSNYFWHQSLWLFYVPLLKLLNLTTNKERY